MEINVYEGNELEFSTQNYRWYTSLSADDTNHDQEVDLDAIGSPGGASWASVAPDGRPGHQPWGQRLELSTSDHEG